MSKVLSFNNKMLYRVASDKLVGYFGLQIPLLFMPAPHNYGFTIVQGTTLHTGTYEFRINVPNAVKVSMPVLADQGWDNLTIVDGIATAYLSEDVYVGNASVFTTYVYDSNGDALTVSDSTVSLWQVA